MAAHKSEKLVVRSRRPKGEDGHKVFSVRLLDHTVVRIEEIAALTGRSRNELIQMFLDFALENCIVEKE